MHCPECMKEARASAPRTKPAVVTAFRRGTEAPVVTWTIIGICIVVYIAQLVSRGAVGDALFYHPLYTETQPWRMITSLFVHSESSFLHIIFNMYSLLVIGPLLERAVGHLRFLALYLLSGLGGSIAVLLIDPRIGVLGASGAIFGLLGAFFIINRHLGGNNLQLLIVIGLNLVIGFVIPNIAWQAHIGGLITGGIVALVYLRTRRQNQRNEQILLLAGVLIGLIVITVIGVSILPSRFA